MTKTYWISQRYLLSREIAHLTIIPLLFRTRKTFHKTQQNNCNMQRGSMHTEFPFPLSSGHQRDIHSAIFASTETTHVLPTFSLQGERAARTAREAQTLPTCQRETRVQSEFKGFWILPTPLATTFSSCNDPSDSAEALCLLQKSVVIC